MMAAPNRNFGTQLGSKSITVTISGPPGEVLTLVLNPGNKQTTVTLDGNGQGSYTFSNLNPGTYDLSATAAGKAMYDHPGLVVQ
jgi:hypothetical protein